MILSMFSDMISLLTIHIYVSYSAATAVCHRIIQTAGSLWNLFRGIYDPRRFLGVDRIGQANATTFSNSDWILGITASINSYWAQCSLH